MCLRSIEKPEYTEWKERICCRIGIYSDRHRARLSNAQSRNISLKRLILLALAALTAACATLTEPKPQSDIPAQTVENETPLDPQAQYEKTKLECADEGGNWVWYIHVDGIEEFSFTMRCYSRDEPRRRSGDLSFKDPGLLPYDATVVYSRARNKKVARFARIDPDSKEVLVGNLDFPVQRE